MSEMSEIIIRNMPKPVIVKGYVRNHHRHCDIFEIVIVNDDMIYLFKKSCNRKFKKFSFVIFNDNVRNYHWRYVKTVIVNGYVRNHHG